MGEENTTVQKLDLEIIPAILVKTKKEFMENIEKVKKYVNEVHIDVMDNKFVPNYTVKPEEIEDLPKGVKYEFHWMVENPLLWMDKIIGNHLHQIHVETIKKFYVGGKTSESEEEREKYSISQWKLLQIKIKENGGRIGIVLNPSTNLNKIEKYVQEVNRVTIMCVVPGYSHQGYLESMEEKIKELRDKYPSLEIEVDGGINFETIKRASASGADKFVSCSTIFSASDPKEAIEKLKKNAYKARGIEYDKEG